jgi:SNF2 family DNA or RNA helicase
MMHREQDASIDVCGRCRWDIPPSAVGINEQVWDALSDSAHSKPSVTYVSRGGWLCDEMGMGKTLVVVALILANPGIGHCTDSTVWKIWEERRTFPLPPDRISLDEPGTAYLEYVRRIKTSPPPSLPATAADECGRLKTKATLVYTSISLFGQWESEIARFAPSLIVKRYHSSGTLPSCRLYFT